MSPCAAPPFAGIRLGGFGRVANGFCRNAGDCYGENLRAGIESVPAGPMDAARGTGLTRLQAMAYAVLPRAVRNVLPDLVSDTPEVVTLTSTAGLIALPELLLQPRQARGVTDDPTPIAAADPAYCGLLWPLVRLVSRLEYRAIPGRR